MKRKIIGMIICILMIAATVIPAAGTQIDNNTIIPTNMGNTLYVGGSGPGNYTRIQDAIDDAWDDDIIYVYDDSSPYYESLTIKRGITLIGEDRETTIIDGLKLFKTIISISADWVTIEGFTIQNCKPSAEIQCVGIRIFNGNHITISNNIITNNTHEYAYTAGIHIKGSIGNYNTIIDNIFVNNGVGIEFSLTKTFTSIENNTFINHLYAIRMVAGGDFDNSSIIGNTIDKCGIEGIELYGSNNIISGNTISNQMGDYPSNTAISIRGSYNQIIDNIIFNNNIGIELFGRNNIISGNTISNQTDYSFFSSRAAIY